MESSEPPNGRQALAVLLLLCGWVFAYNLLILDLSVFDALFGIADTISEDLVVGSVVTVVVGGGIVIAFTVTKLYTQIIAEASSFRMLERIAMDELGEGRWREAGLRILYFEDEEITADVVPRTAAAVLFSFSAMYLMSWLYLVLFSEALFFVSWSAGVDLPLSEHNLELLPTLALSIPFSARIMAYLRYPYASDYADFMPAALFVLLLVASLGYLFESEDQKFFLVQVWSNPEWTLSFARNGLSLAFVPVFAEGIFWLAHLLAGDRAA